MDDCQPQEDAPGTAAVPVQQNVVPESLCTHIVREIQSLFAAGKSGCFPDGCFERIEEAQHVDEGKKIEEETRAARTVLYTGTECRRANGIQAESVSTNAHDAFTVPKASMTGAIPSRTSPLDPDNLTNCDTCTDAITTEQALRRIAVPVIATDILALLRSRKLLAAVPLPNACDIVQCGVGETWMSSYHNKPQLLVTFQGSQRVDAFTATGSENGGDVAAHAETAWSVQVTPGSLVRWQSQVHQVLLCAEAETFIGMNFHYDPTLCELDLGGDTAEGSALRKKSEKKRRRERKAAARAANIRKSASASASLAIVPIGAMKSVPIPWDLLSTAQELKDPKIMPSVEVDHVKNLYNAIAPHWHYTRFKAWPKVEEFVLSLPRGSLVGDIGCGNGKNIPACSAVGYGIGCDISVELVKICVARGFQTLVADTMNLPYRSNTFDATLSIAVLHHVSTVKRRVLALAEITRVLTVGGRALVYAWALEQTGAKSGHKFGSQDVFVPWHFHDKSQAAPHKQQIVATTVSTAPATYKSSLGTIPGQGQPIAEVIPAQPSDAAPLEGNSDGADCAEASAANDDAAATIDADATGDAPPTDTPAPHEGQVYQRYCHVYRKGELEYLATMLRGVETVHSYYDTGNWAVVLQKIGPVSVHLDAGVDY
eukprot:m.591639 g.591639  ORF g.591639 m.591639 type:complete len:656 (-) comp22382_c0_seq2:387-2354(-)